MYLLIIMSRTTPLHAACGIETIEPATIVAATSRVFSPQPPFARAKSIFLNIIYNCLIYQNGRKYLKNERWYM